MKLAYSGVSETSHSVEDNDSRDKAKADILGASRRSLGSHLPKCVRVLRSTVREVLPEPRSPDRGTRGYKGSIKFQKAFLDHGNVHMFRGNAEKITVPLPKVKSTTVGGFTFAYDDIITFKK